MYTSYYVIHNTTHATHTTPAHAGLDPTKARRGFVLLFVLVHLHVERTSMEERGGKKGVLGMGKWQGRHCGGVTMSNVLNSTLGKRNTVRAWCMYKQKCCEKVGRTVLYVQLLGM
jgi:hypothetical protein